ncbi:MAG: NERD domain-containing protein [Proteobacteria bacterium]|nr:NERD domain-containing protein [Pseudomonadota bacterium]
MSGWTEQIGIVFGVCAAGLAGPVAAIVLLLRRKANARQRRRSPISISLLRGPGHSLREQLAEANDDIIWDVSFLMVLPLLVLALFLAQGHLVGLQQMLRLAPVYALAAVAFIAYMLRKLLKAGTRLDQLKAGYDAEVAVGQELDQLMRQGAATFHDFPAELFNIDHVVVAAEGVFAIETKGYTKPKQGGGKAEATVAYDGETLKFPTWTTKAPLEQAERQAVWLAKWLSSAVGSPVSVLPVVALPGWFVERSGRGPVRVFSGKELPGLLRSRGTQRLPAQDVQRIAHQVEQRCRTVAPTYAEASKAR